MPTQKPIEPRDIVGNPEEFCDVPSLLQSAWAELKTRRGQSVNFATIGEPAYRIEPNTASKPRVVTIRTRLRPANLLASRPHGDDAA